MPIIYLDSIRCGSVVLALEVGPDCSSLSQPLPRGLLVEYRLWSSSSPSASLAPLPLVGIPEEDKVEEKEGGLNGHEDWVEDVMDSLDWVSTG